MPVRHVRSSSRGKTGIFFPNNGSDALPYESHLERDHLQVLSATAEVAEIVPQPLSIAYRDEVGPRRTYTPDVLVRYVEASERRPDLCEVKPWREVKKHWAELKPAFRAAVSFCEEVGFKFQIVTEHKIYTPRLENARFLHRYGDVDTPDEVASEILSHLSDTRPTSLGDLLELPGGPWIERAEWISHVYHLIVLRRISVDLDSRLALESKLFLPGGVT